MKRLIPTVLIALLCVAAFVGFLYSTGSGHLTSLLGKPAQAIGAKALDLQRQKVQFIRLKSKNEVREYKRLGSTWQDITNGDSERADYRKLEKLLHILENAEIMAVLPKDYRAPETATTVMLREHQGSTGAAQTVTLNAHLPRYEIEVQQDQDLYYPTFSVTTADGHSYVCKSSIQEPYPELSRESLRDHRPFFFHPELVSEISYQTDSEPVTLSRATQESEWQITSPIKLRTDTKQVQRLVANLYALEATGITEREPSSAPTTTQLMLKSFNDVLPPQGLKLEPKQLEVAHHDKTEYSFSPDVLKHVIPNIDNLRAKNLSDLPISNIHSILLQSKAQPYPVTLAVKRTAMGTPRWMYQTGTTWEPACEIAVSDFLTALTKDAVIGFSLTDIPAGREPDKSIMIRTRDEQLLSYEISLLDEQYHLKQSGESQSAIITPSHFNKLITAPTEWRDKTLWRVSPITLRGFQRQIGSAKVENYSYNYNLEQWNAQINNQQANDDLDLVKANAYLEFLESISVIRWIKATDLAIRKASPTPAFQITALSEIYNHAGESEGMEKSNLQVYEIPSWRNLYLATIQAGQQPAQHALLDKTTYTQLTQKLIID